MKKSLLALAVLGAFAGAASAQSSVTLSGMVDAGIKARGDDWSMGGSQSGYNNFTISGKEDLGGGLNAFFVLNHRFVINNGKSNTSTTGVSGGSNDVFWRNAFVGLGGGWGDVRLGRMLMPLQDMNGGFDAFDTGYVGTTHTGGLMATVRANSAVYYRSPSFGGLSFHAAVAEGGAQYQNDTRGSFGAGGAGYAVPTAEMGKERPMGFNVRYAAGPINVGAAYDINAGDYDTWGLYGSWDFGFMKLFGQYESGDVTVGGVAANKESVDIYSISAKIPMGAFTWKVGYLGVSSDASNGDGYKLGGGVEYALSKRTSLYSNIGEAGGDRAKTVTGGDDFQFDVGVTHRF